MNLKNVINTAEFREKLPLILKRIQEEKKPVIVGRFSEPKAVLIDIATYSWQSKILGLISRLDSLTDNEAETLEFLIDTKTRNLLFKGLSEIEAGETIALEEKG